MKERKYSEQINIENEQKLRALVAELPQFCREYFIGIEPSTSSRTRIAYAYDLGVFFHYLHENNSTLSKIEITDFPIDILEQITPMDIEEYLQYLKFYTHNGKEYTNDERGQMRKLACLRSFYNYFFRKEIIEKNPAALVQMPKQHEKNIDVVLLDVMMPKLDGFEVCRELRRRSMVPIIMVTARGEDFERIMGLDIGADDYILKPFSAGEVMARVRAILRRVQPREAEQQNLYSVGNLVIDLDKYLVTIGGADVTLTKKEVELLWTLAKNSSKVFSRENLLDSIWGYDYFGDSRTVDSHIKRLRAKVDKFEHEEWEIKTIWGVGYSFEEKEHAQ